MSDIPTKRESLGEWELYFFLSGPTDEGVFVGSAEVHQGRRMFCKLVSVKPQTTAEAAIEALRHQCATWIDEWSTRAHSAHTGPAPLQ
ncbi:hypothetical protein GNX71_16375 [Variovorax sp. RKNM96]|uniref:hypothetical protein n=1 Tax=Variovorax sp. RKNM96 TaxID=2681552 RepID=UPI001980579E|nr:hypothetical protein [Variovorax sp. RKNM96]QSI31061.1 hypothetical protein GNX71_16375 [Variovorax sp. RKNM96]